MPDQNPKLVDSNIVDCIPQVGECPNKCSECFFNGGRFYRDINIPQIPTILEVGGKIVRMNSGNDSNHQRDLVIKVAKQYGDFFFNTSTPCFDFSGPVVFTANRQCPQNKVHLVPNPPHNLMFVRARVSPWNLGDVGLVVGHYLKKHGIPVVLTFMRYYDGDLIPEHHKDDYEWKEHIINDYWVLKPEAMLRIMEHFKGIGVRMCGTPYSSYCVDCRNCEFLYLECKKKMQRHGLL